MSGIIPGTTYHFRIKTINQKGTIYGNDITFITLGKLPSAKSVAASGILIDGASLNATVNANDLNTNITFEWGLTDTYGNLVNASPASESDHSDHDFTAVVTGLTPGTLYHFRVKAVNQLGAAYGNDIIFATLGKVPDVISQAATYVTGESATFNGTVNPNSFNAAAIAFASFEGFLRAFVLT